MPVPIEDELAELMAMVAELQADRHALLARVHSLETQILVMKRDAALEALIADLHRRGARVRQLPLIFPHPPSLGYPATRQHQTE
jgi:predicted  nucleic acid-binding Zn-ribbon protein